jgi:hypothetical protein
MECSGVDYLSWQLFGFDLMLDARFHVRLLEINATPASAAAILPALVQHLRERAIESIFPTEAPATAAAARSRAPSPPEGGAEATGGVATAAAAASAVPPSAAFAVPSTPRGSGGGGGGSGRGLFSPAAILARPCQCAVTLRGISKAAFLAPQDRSINLFDPL